MPGRHTLVYIYECREGGCSLWQSGYWNCRGQWFRVLRSPWAKEDWLRTVFEREVFVHKQQFWRKLNVQLNK